MYPLISFQIYKIMTVMWGLFTYLFLVEDMFYFVCLLKIKQFL